jgi:hypothetical protein
VVEIVTRTIEEFQILSVSDLTLTLQTLPNQLDTAEWDLESQQCDFRRIVTDRASNSPPGLATIEFNVASAGCASPKLPRLAAAISDLIEVMPFGIQVLLQLPHSSDDAEETVEIIQRTRDRDDASANDRDNGRAHGAQTAQCVISSRMKACGDSNLLNMM